MGKKRLQFDFTQEEVDRLDDFRDKKGLSRVEVVRRAVDLYMRLHVKIDDFEITLRHKKTDQTILVWF